MKAIMSCVGALVIMGCLVDAAWSLEPPAFERTWGSMGSGDGQFNNPMDVAVDSYGSVYVADYGNHRIQKFSSDGSFLTSWGTLGAGWGELSYPQGIALDSQDHVYVSEGGNHRVQKFTSDGAYLTGWYSGFLYPVGIAIGAADDVYVADAGHDRIVQFTSDGTYIREWPAGDNPTGVAIDSQGDVFVVSQYDDTVSKYAADGAFLLDWGETGTADGQFSQPVGVAVDAEDNVFVCENGGNRIQAFNSEGGFVLKWGASGTGNGEFTYPYGLDVRGQSLCVADAGNHRIQKFTLGPSGQVTFTDIGAGLPGVYTSSVAWGDYDNDGDLDVLLTGSYLSCIYRNDSGTFADAGAGLIGVAAGSVAWGDCDNDGDLDILLSGWTGSESVSRIYRNEGGTFTSLVPGLPGVYTGAVAWGDYDNDGDLDILLAGWTGSESISRIYRNEGGTFSDIDAGLPGLSSGLGSVAWGDYDNDGDLDILLAGYSAGYLTRIYRNDEGTFSDVGAGLRGVEDGSVAWGDYDIDGDLDILLMGIAGSERISRVYRNDGGMFTDLGEVGLPEAGSSNSAAWGDYDNDGDLDILLSGWTGSESISCIYRNDGASFTDVGAGLPGVSSGSAAWGDYDNDGSLDVLLTGSGISRIYRNDGAPPNTPPAAPSDLTASVAGDQATLRWNASTDAETPSAGLTYNIRVGTTLGGGEVASAMADIANGYRRLPAFGNAQQRLSWTVTLPSLGHYYWSVQAVDGAFAGSAFAPTQTIDTITGVPDPQSTIPAVFALCQNTPNPFNPLTLIRYELPRSARVQLGAYDVAGRLVRTLVDEDRPAGRYEMRWNGTSDRGGRLPSGVYFCRMQAGSFRETRRMTLAK